MDHIKLALIHFSVSRFHTTRNRFTVVIQQTIGVRHDDDKTLGLRFGERNGPLGCCRVELQMNTVRNSRSAETQ